MSATTKAMAPWEHELSQTVGLAMAVVAASDRRQHEPASAVTFTYTAATIGAEFIGAVVGMNLMLDDFDAEFEEISGTIGRQLADWRAEIDWAHYEVRHVIGAAA
ncbi:hypothetical protein OS122_02730 [Mycolicibacterium mucogenicum]|uniref:hypothetical protein n=1 Tax=Mycolicibacterium mucogenicum TaxID=56689 RepID=UPI00226A56FC|nr:hypothetical protein [Mycolicibacterium mucogenicum]MCX8559814.1 hypothetical protein [Mycolicibacterium mucogenicum]